MVLHYAFNIWQAENLIIMAFKNCSNYEQTKYFTDSCLAELQSIVSYTSQILLIKYIKYILGISQMGIKPLSSPNGN